MYTKTKLRLLLLAFSITIIGNSQEIVYSEEDFAKIMASIEFERPENGNAKNQLTYDWNIYFKKFDDAICLDFISGREIFSLFHPFSFESHSYQRFKKEHSSYTNYLGSYGSKEKRSFVYTKNSHKKFLVINHDNTIKKTTESILDFKLKDRIFLGHFTYRNQFYIITWKKFTRVFSLYLLDEDNTFKAVDINLEKGEFYKDGILESFPKRSISRDPVINMGKAYYNEDKKVLTEIKKNIPNANKDVTERNKFFVHNNTLYAALDFNKESTSLLIIDLESGKSVTHQISKSTTVKIDVFNQKSNSYLFEKLLFQVKGDKKNVSLSLFDLNTNTQKRIYTFNRKSPYLKEKNLLVTDEIVSRFNLNIDDGDKEEIIQKKLRKIMKSGNQVGLQITENEHTFLVSLGGYLERENASPMIMFGAVGGLAHAMTYPYGAYGSFVRDESFDFFIDKKTFELTFDEFLNPYQRMENFINEEYDDKSDKKIKWVTKFNVGPDYYLGYLDRKTKEYQIRKFN